MFALNSLTHGWLTWPLTVPAVKPKNIIDSGSKKCTHFLRHILMSCALTLASLLTLAQAMANNSADDIYLGPSSVPGQLNDVEFARDSEHESWPSLPSADKYHLSLAADYQVLFQQLSNSPGEDSGAGGAARFYGTWQPNSGSKAPGQLVFKIEHRHNLVTDIAPKQLLSEGGIAGISAPTFSDKGLVLTNLYWGQSFADNSIGLVAGVVDVSDYIDVYGLINVWTEFNNLAFSSNPTIPIPDQGLGVGGRLLFSSNFYLVASIADANGDPHHPEDFFDGFFDTAEYFTHVEFGRIGSWESRSIDNTHVTLWQSDKREEAGVSSDWGVALSWSQQRGRWLPFARAGYADRGVGLQKKMLSAGTGYSVRDGRDYIGGGISWGKAADSTRDQYFAEGYYKWQVYSHVLVVPGVQYIRNPAYNEYDNHIWLASIKCRLTF